MEEDHCAGRRPGASSSSAAWEDYSSVLDPLIDSGVFDMRDGSITPLLPATVAKPTTLGKNLFRARPAWFFQMEVL
nr:unnamed protein product [Digitaria exilis]